ncbi:Predicted arabinose efflux permease, MFS family [Geodermatophilus siccatus]|uniref:Predicted arabinose efflux permease, MFS family n=1 Tax=Geodermatophilus siccatus TaxID=1137991 RepID=A0A1G9XEJ4_9ACTN|nr:MFS transporter [Geodermatophilus siccatus]SDM94961.1 Predicted arabinose efflux permease, MFS family [Geodermatophilus siccatus]
MACDTTPVPVPAAALPGAACAPPQRTLTALTAAAFATVTIELSPTGLLPVIAADLAVSPSAAGSLVATWAVTLAATSLALVRATRRLPRQRVLAVALLVCGAATLATAAAPSLGAAVVARVVGAAAHGLVWALLVPHVADLVPPERLGRAVSTVLVGPTAASVLGVPVAASLGGVLGWRWTLALLAALTLPPALVLVRGRTVRRDGAGTAAGAWWRHPSARPVLRTAGGTAALLAGHFAAATYLAVLVTDGAGLPGGAVPAVLFVFGLAGVLGLAVAGPLSDRRPATALPAVAVAFAAGLAALLLVGTHPAVAVTLVAIWGVLIGLLPPVFQTRVTRIAAPEIRDVAGAVAITALNVGIAAGAALGGLVLARSGPTGLVLAAAGAAAAGALVLLVRRPAVAPGNDGAREAP